MNGIYRIIKKEIQNIIKQIAETRGIGVMNVLTTTDGEISSACMTAMEDLSQRMYEDFEISKEAVWECFEGFRNEIVDFICPDYNSTIGENYTAHLNRRLVKAGYDTVKPEVLELLFNEFKGKEAAKE